MMQLNPATLSHVIDALRTHGGELRALGVSRLKIGDTEVEFRPMEPAASPAEEEQQPESGFDPDPMEDAATFGGRLPRRRLTHIGME